MKFKVGDELLDNYVPDTTGIITRIDQNDVTVTWRLPNNESIDLKYKIDQLSFFLSKGGLLRMKAKPNQIWKSLNEV